MRLLITLVASLGAACAASPELGIVEPRSATRGTELWLTLRGRRLADAEGLLFERAGLLVLEVKVVSDAQVKVRLRIAEDCPLGAHKLLLRTKSGLSNIKTFHVGVLPELAEAEPNGRPEEAQPIALNRTIKGILTAEDTDRFRLNLAARTRVVIEVQALRLLDQPLDTRLVVRDASGRVLHDVDDSPLGSFDPYLAADLEAGSYELELRETTHAGNEFGHYLLHVGTFPRPLGMMPAGGRPGETVEVTWLGDDAPPPQTITFPVSSGPIHQVFPKAGAAQAPTPLGFAVADLPNFLEPSTPPPEVKGKNRFQTAHPFEVPAALNGVISTPGELDIWRFTAKKGQRLDLKVVARILRSPLDAILQVHSMDGKTLAYNDDTGAADSQLGFTVPSDGEYAVVIHDHRRGGSPVHFYRIHVRLRAARVTSSVVQQPGSADDSVSVPRGGRAVRLVRASQVDAGSGASPEIHGLPAGVTVSASPYQPGVDTVPVLFESAADAPLDASWAEVAVPAGDKGNHIDDGFLQVVPTIRVRNQQVFFASLLRRLPVAVLDRLPYRLELEQPPVALVQEGPLQLRFKVLRDQGFTSPVQVRMAWNPPGVGSGLVTVPGDQSEGVMPINAAQNARAGSWKIALVGIVDLKGLTSQASGLVDLLVTAPLVTASLATVRGDQGVRVELGVDLVRRQDISSPTYQCKLLNLPKGVSVEEITVPSDARGAKFAVDIDANAPVGRHRGLLLQLLVPTPSGNIVHLFRGGELRIDKPLPPRAKSQPAQSPVRGTVQRPKT